MFGAHIEQRGATSVLIGYGAVFYVPSDPGTKYDLAPGVEERIDPAAFTAALRDKPNDVTCTYNHNPDWLLGKVSSKTVRLSVDKVGLRYECDLPDTTAAKDVLASIERGDVTGSSFTFQVTDVAWTECGDMAIRNILSVELFDVGPQTSAAYTSTKTCCCVVLTIPTRLTPSPRHS